MINDIARKSINVDAPNNIPVATVKEYDDFILKLSLMKYNTPFEATGQTVTLGVKAPNGLFEQTTDITINKEQIDIKLKSGIVSKAGTCAMELKLVDADGSMTTASFFIVVNPKILGDEAVQASDEFDIFTKTVEKVEEDYNSLKGGLLAEDKVVYFQNEINKSNAQLAENVQQVNGIKKPFNSYNGGIVTIVDDDARLEFFTTLKPILDAKGIKCTIAGYTKVLGDATHMTYAQLLDLQNQGYEIASHGVNHYKIADISDDEAKYELSESLRLLEENGINVNSFVYPDGCSYSDYRSRNLVKQYYNCGVATSNGVENKLPIESYCLTRYNLITNSLASLKSYVDTAYTNKSWLILMSHSWMPELDTTKQQEISDLIDYIQSKSMPIVTLKEGLDMIGNIIEVDNTIGKRYAVSKVGDVNTKYGMKFLSGNITNIDAPITDYEVGVTTVFQSANGTTNTPTSGIGGVCFVIRTISTSDTYSFRLWYDYSGTNVYKSRWKSGAWESWALMGASATSGITTTYGIGTNLDTLVSDYPSKTITHLSFSTADSTTSPSGNKGVLVTYRLEASSDQFTYQEWRGYQKNTVYMRYWNTTTSAWSEWKLQTPA